MISTLHVRRPLKNLTSVFLITVQDEETVLVPYKNLNKVFFLTAVLLPLRSWSSPPELSDAEVKLLTPEEARRRAMKVPFFFPQKHSFPSGLGGQTGC